MLSAIKYLAILYKHKLLEKLRTFYSKDKDRGKNLVMRSRNLIITQNQAGKSTFQPDFITFERRRVLSRNRLARQCDVKP